MPEQKPRLTHGDSDDGEGFGHLGKELRHVPRILNRTVLRPVKTESLHVEGVFQADLVFGSFPTAVVTLEASPVFEPRQIHLAGLLATTLPVPKSRLPPLAQPEETKDQDGIAQKPA